MMRHHEKLYDYLKIKRLKGKVKPEEVRGSSSKGKAQRKAENYGRQGRRWIVLPSRRAAVIAEKKFQRPCGIKKLWPEIFVSA
ncbi:MAG: hypothetical protein R2860_05110 [Desulfobacterales bacterium]